MGKKDKSAKKAKKDRKAELAFETPDLASAVIQAARSFRTVLSRNLSDCGLYAGQDGVILLLNEEDGQTAGAIAQKLQVKPPTMTRTIGRMEAQGFLERRDDSGDGRLTKVWITEAGRLTVERIQAASQSAQLQATQDLTEKQMRTLVKLLRIVDGNLHGSDIEEAE